MNHCRTATGQSHRWQVRSNLRVILAALMTAAGTLHFVATEAYMTIMPPYLPLHRELVLISGALFFLGGVGLLIPKRRSAAGVALIVLYVAVLPANVNMAINNIQPESFHIAPALLWLRIPLQLIIIAWAWWVSRPDPPSRQRGIVRGNRVEPCKPILHLSGGAQLTPFSKDS